MDLGFIFHSSAQNRYENGICVGSMSDVHRAVQVEPSTDGCEGYNLVESDGYIVTIYNLDGNHPRWNSNVQMASKPMRIESQTADRIVLRGYPLEALSPFGWIDFDCSDYGLSIYLKDGEIEKCVLHMYDRGVDLEYLGD